MSERVAEDELVSGSGTQFCPSVVAALREVLRNGDAHLASGS